MQPKHALLSSFSGATFLAIASLNSVQAAPLLIVGQDEEPGMCGGEARG